MQIVAQNPGIIIVPILLLFFICCMCCVCSYCLSSLSHLTGTSPLSAIIPPAKTEGEQCTLGTDCQGNLAGQEGTLSCCLDQKTNKKTCQTQLKDWAGVGYCPSDCSSGPAGVAGSGPGTCSKYHWPRNINEPCTNHTDCLGWGPGPTAVACCQGTCQNKKADWAGIGYCPYECVGHIGGSPGSC